MEKLILYLTIVIGFFGFILLVCAIGLGSHYLSQRYDLKTNNNITSLTAYCQNQTNTNFTNPTNNTTDTTNPICDELNYLLRFKTISLVLLGIALSFSVIGIVMAIYLASHNEGNCFESKGICLKNTAMGSCLVSVALFFSGMFLFFHSDAETVLLVTAAIVTLMSVPVALLAGLFYVVRRCVDLNIGQDVYFSSD